MDVVVSAFYSSQPLAYCQASLASCGVLSLDLVPVPQRYWEKKRWATQAGCNTSLVSTSSCWPSSLLQIITSYFKDL